MGLSRTERVWLAALALLSVAALVPWDPAGPFDARNYQPLAGVALAYSGWGAVVEPLLAPAHAIFGAPDYRLSAASFLIWAVVVAMLVIYRRERRGGRRRRVAGPVALVAGGLGGFFLFAYVLASAVLHLPGWQLVVDDPDWLVADLQTHTYGSHDAFVSPPENLAWHAERGYDLIAVTEHKDPQGAFETAALAGTEPGSVIAGVEINSEQEEFLLGLGLNPEIPVSSDSSGEYARRFVDAIHQQHDGAVIALAWRIGADNIDRLVELGVDAFEIANTAHPEIPMPVREAMLRAERRGRVLVASTDWHGWSGFTRTWTLVRLPGHRAMSPVQRAEAVVAKLKARDQGAFVPVAAGYLGPPSMLRLAGAPLVETARYFGELSPLRLAAWWGWSLVLMAASRRLRQSGVRPLAVFAPVAGLLVGGGLLWGAGRLAQVPEAAGGAVFAGEMAADVVVVGVAALGVAVVVLYREVRRVLGSRSVM